MIRVKLMTAALGVAFLAALAGGVAAQQTNVSERTFLTFSSAVEMPGVTLQPGTYVFRLADTPTRNVVQVLDESGENILGQWLFVPSERTEVTGDTVVMFKETAEGTTPAVQYWYFPGERIGKEFVYSEDQARQIAARTGAGVRTEDGLIEGIADASVEAAGAVADVAGDVGGAAADLVTGADDQPARAEIQAEAPSRPVGTAGAAEGQLAQAELPRTASPLALSGLIGLLSLMGAAGVRAMRR
jgi:hypothetical protein